MCSGSNLIHSSQRAEQAIIEEGKSYIKILSPAKINLILSVGAKGPDHYHMIRSIMSKITLYDIIEIRKEEKGSGIEIETNVDWVPCGFDNLAYRAASLLLGATDQDIINKGKIRIKLTKNIPAKAGLGGGSSNAATVLLALKKLLNIELSKKELDELALMLGSDVPFFMGGGLCLCSGRGQIVKSLKIDWPFWALIIKPDIELSTRDVYQHHRLTESKGTLLIDSVIKLLAKRKPSEIAEYLYNDLEPAAFRISPELGLLRKELEIFFNRPVRMTGSGSALFVLFDEKHKAAEEAQRCAGSYPGLKIWLVTNNSW